MGDAAPIDLQRSLFCVIPFQESFMARKKGSKTAFVLREAREEDLPVLVDFLAKLALHVSGAPPQNLRKNEHNRLLNVLRSSLGDDNKLLTVAENPDAGIIGMGYIYVWHSQGIWEQAEALVYKSGIIDDVWVEPEFRNLGIFRALLQELVGFAESHHVHELILEYAESNKEAKAAWAKLGFKTTGIRAAAFTSTVKEALASPQL
ncbi:Predicted acetyltransferase [Marinobacter sp. ELB17]|nr:Predicted acetyltransferase [Marinobacter sp. ELB17]